MSHSLAIFLVAAAAAGQSYEVRLTEYRTENASTAQIAAYESGDPGILIGSMRGNVRSSAAAELRPGGTARVDAPRISGTVSLEREGDDFLLTVDALPFYRGSPLRLARCDERRIAASKASVQGRVQINLRTVRIGGC